MRMHVSFSVNVFLLVFEKSFDYTLFMKICFSTFFTKFLQFRFYIYIYYLSEIDFCVGYEVQVNIH